MKVLEQASIPLGGPGLVDRASDAYGPGEYKNLTNLVITPEGTLKKRRPVQGLFSGITNYLDEKIIGTWGSDVVYASYDYVGNNGYARRSRRIYGGGEGTFNDNLISGLPAALLTDIQAKTGFPAGANTNYLIEGIFQYNNQCYVIILAVNRSTALPITTYNSRLVIVQGTFFWQNPNAAGGPVLSTACSNIESANWTESYTTADWNAVPNIPMPSFFMYKERLFVATRDTLYFSRATDPTKFATVDDGGFIKFPGKTIKKVVPVGDLIYVIFDASISVLSYNTSPNTDAQVRVISDGVGGEDAVLYGDLVYVLSYKYLYGLSGSNVTKLADIPAAFLQNNIGATSGASNADLTAGQAPSLKLEVWDDGVYYYLRKLKYATVAGHISHIHPVGYSDMYRLDLSNGHTSKFTFGYGTRNMMVADSISTRPSNRNPNDRFYLMGKTESTTTFDIFYFSKNQTFCAFPSGFVVADKYGIDAYTHSNATHQNCCTIPIELTLLNYSPDSFRYMYRKLRTLMMQADLPSFTPNSTVSAELELNIYAGLPTTLNGTNPFAKQHLISEPVSGLEPSRHVSSYRYGVNQRAKDISINIKTRDSVKTSFVNSMTIHNDFNPAKVLANSLMEIVDLSLIWSETNRGPTNYGKERS